ncbi:50S ribosomal protein L31 [Candidatus Roizmanbacteria bacterium RIFCSPHIGHO2_12_FULL_33_9]|uniref:50S ribosomal protein L31 n=1 Tax=Candidatus Roizmanbacteria bacterium RIFCSPHIGHO2_12_FULL_33_9 TaxID=1802045 RepID=A0A1F7HFM8_9BACT|nr:MAG: 50S ribosomal protein L31 [Candidatus Roizmanbacteria bacterium RIFCSPHIGHO2_12_FULL_33_9]
MKSNIHPQIFDDAQVVCSCGKSFTTRSTKQSINVEVCSSCHPYFTGEHRFIDTKGRVEEFQKKQEIARKMKATMPLKKKDRNREENAPKTLKELLGEI